jgi:hypothetical protein
MVERTQEEHGVDARIRQPQCAGIAHLGTFEGDRWERSSRLARLLDMQRHRIYQMDAVSTLGEPDGVSSGTATHVGDHRGGSWEISPHQDLGANELERALTSEEPVSFKAEGIERRDMA